jgi:hypothetical protein
MSYRGTLLGVTDKETKTEPKKIYWAVEIETEEKGRVVFNLWDHAFAGLPGKDGEEPLGDVHAMIGKAVVFDAKVGTFKTDKGGNDTLERWPSSLVMVQESIVQDTPDEARSPKAEAAMGITQHLEAAQRHLGAALELARKVE